MRVAPRTRPRATAGTDAAAAALAASLVPVDFHGPHQAGIVTSQPSDAIIAAFDVVAADRAALAETLQSLTQTARVLTQGEVPPSERSVSCRPRTTSSSGPGRHPTG